MLSVPPLDKIRVYGKKYDNNVGPCIRFTVHFGVRNWDGLSAFDSLFGEHDQLIGFSHDY